MKSILAIDKKLKSFKQGIHPTEYKFFSEKCPIERMPLSEKYTIPLSQHIGKSAKAIVKKGQKVRRGEKIAQADGFVSVSIHSPVDGIVEDIGWEFHPNGQLVPSIVIKTDFLSHQQLQPLFEDIDMDSIDYRKFLKIVQDGGIVGLGGAAFPSHVKLSIPEGKKCQYILANGCECEPFLTADHRIMVEYPQKIIGGLQILAKYLNPVKSFIGIENNKPDAIQKLKQTLKHCNHNIEVIPLEVKYPQGAEKMLATAILGNEIPKGKLPIDVGLVVSNVGTLAAIYDLIFHAKPLIERIVTVTGHGIKRPANLLIPIGTPLIDVINHCRGMKGKISDYYVLLGGPMMGQVQKNLNAPVIKGTSGIIVLPKKFAFEQEQYNCIKCGRCVDACPMFLNPSMMGLLAKKGLYEEMEEWNVLDCFECGCCSFVCPSNIPLVQYFRVAKSIIREKKLKEKSNNA